jgi:hypothetical protein
MVVLALTNMKEGTPSSTCSSENSSSRTSRTSRNNVKTNGLAVKGKTRDREGAKYKAVAQLQILLSCSQMPITTAKYGERLFACTKETNGVFILCTTPNILGGEIHAIPCAR